MARLATDIVEETPELQLGSPLLPATSSAVSTSRDQPAHSEQLMDEQAGTTEQMQKLSL